MTEADAMTEPELRVALAMVELDLQQARQENLRFEALAKEAAASAGTQSAPDTENKATPTPSPIPMKYSCTRDWVYGWLSGMTHKPLMRWCDQWDHHPEAVVRLTALWQSWEVARANPSPLEMSRWILEHHDRHMEVLTSIEGPFTECGRQGHVIPRAAVPAEAEQIIVPDRQLQRA